MKRTETRSALVVGCGYLGAEVLKELSRTGWYATGVTLSELSAVSLRDQGLQVLAADIRTADLQRITQDKPDVVVHCASTGRGGTVAYREIFLEFTERMMKEVEFEHFIFTSSTSVYAQTDGSLVSEDAPAEPERETGRLLRETEELVLAHQGTVLRLAGLYGPGRCVPLQKLLSGDASLEGNGQRIINSIHRNDSVSAIYLAAEHRWPGIFNVTDDSPATQLEWFNWVCTRLQIALPPFVPPNQNRKRGWTSKKVSNAKLRSHGWVPRYPSFREGVEELLKVRKRRQRT